MENGEGNLESRFAGLAVSDPINVHGNDGLFQVMKAVEAAEATIKQQVEENIRLRSELQKRNEELEKYKLGDLNCQKPQSADRWEGRVSEPHSAPRINAGLGNQTSGIGNMDINPGHDLVNSRGFQKNLMRNDTDHAIQTQVDNFFDNSKVNGSLKVIPGSQMVSDSSGFSQFESPPSTSFFPSRSALEGGSDSQLGVSGRGFMAMAEVNNPNGPKQDLIVKIREHEEEITQLRKHLTEYSIKEAQICNEKYVMEKRISYMRMAFDQQQQDLVDAASKAISYRQEIMEENVRLTYALQSAQQERSTFISSLMPLLAEYSLQPPVADAQSIVSNVKVLFRHLQEQLLITEGKLKDSQYQLAPWRSDVNLSTSAQLAVSPNEIKNGLELVPQSTYSNGKMPSSDHQTMSDGDLLSHPQSGLDDMRNSEPEGLGSYPPLASR